MTNSLLAGVAAVGLMAASALGQTYDSSTSRTTTTTVAPTVIAPVPGATTTTTQQTYDPYNGTTTARSTTTQTVPGAVAAPYALPPTSTYRQEKTVTSNGEVVEKSTRSDTVSPNGRTTTYSQTTTGPAGNN